MKAEDIDIVILSHAHLDHVSGIIGEGSKRFFPNAQIAVSKTEFDFWTDEGKVSATGVMKLFVDSARANLLPNKDRLILVEDGKEDVMFMLPIACSVRGDCLARSAASPLR